MQMQLLSIQCKIIVFIYLINLCTYLNSVSSRAPT